MAEFIFSAFADEAGGGLLHQIEALKANGKSARASNLNVFMPYLFS